MNREEDKQKDASEEEAKKNEYGYSGWPFESEEEEHLYFDNLDRVRDMRSA